MMDRCLATLEFAGAGSIVAREEGRVMRRVTMETLIRSFDPGEVDAETGDVHRTIGFAVFVDDRLLMVMRLRDVMMVSKKRWSIGDYLYFGGR